jgi:hypothetical protein
MTPIPKNNFLFHFENKFKPLNIVEQIIKEVKLLHYGYCGL